MEEVNAAEVKEFLLARARTAPRRAGVVRPRRGYYSLCHLVRFGKARNIRHEPRVSLSVDDEEPPFAFVFIEGTARISERGPDLGRWATRIAGRYMGKVSPETTGSGTASRASCSYASRLTKS